MLRAGAEYTASPRTFFGCRGQAGGLSCCSARGSEMASPCTDPSPASTLCPAQGTTPGPFLELGDEGTSLLWGTVCWWPTQRGVTSWLAFHGRALGGVLCAPEGQGAAQGRGGRGAPAETEAGFLPRRANPATSRAHRRASHAACSLTYTNWL